jgi:hypothetical protein
MTAPVYALNVQPYRFKEGDEAYVRGWDQSTSVKVTTAVGFGDSAFPHYMVIDAEGCEWRIPQVAMSSKPIVEHK